MKNTDTIKVLANLIQIQFDAVHIYETAIERVGDERVRERLETFQQRHHRHLKDLSSAIRELGETPPVPSQDLKGVIFEKLAAVRSITGTEGALKSLATTEEILGRYYQELIPESIPEATLRLLKKHLSDVQVHKEYIDLNVKAVSSSPPG